MEPVVQASIGSLDTVLLQSAGQILGDILFGILEIVSIIPRALTIFAKILMVGLGTFFSVFYLNFTQSFLLFPNPATVPGLAVLGDRMMTLFWLVSPVFVLVWVAQSMMFPNDGERERTLRVLTQRLLKILILIFIAQPAISLIVATTHFFTAFFYPVGFDFRTAVDLMLSLGSSSGGTWATFLILVFGGFFIFLSSLVFFVILIVREFLVYLVYALAPLWGLFYIVDFGPAGFIKQFASSFMKIAGFMLLLGPIIAIVFATGFGIADYTTGAYAQGEQDIQFASGGSEPSSFSTRIIEDIAGAPNEASDGQFQSSGPGPDWKVEPNGISIPEIVLLKTIMFFGSIWLAIGIAIRGMSIAGGSSMSRDVQQFASRIDTRRARMLRARAVGAAEQVYTDVTGNQIRSSAPGGPSRFEASINNVDPDNIFKAESARDYGPLDGVAERLDSVLPRGASDAGKFGEGMRLTGRGLYGVGRVAARPTLRGSVREAGYIVGASDALSAYDTDEISAIPPEECERLLDGVAGFVGCRADDREVGLRGVVVGAEDDDRGPVGQRVAGFDGGERDPAVA